VVLAVRVAWLFRGCPAHLGVLGQAEALSDTYTHWHDAREHWTACPFGDMAAALGVSRKTIQMYVRAVRNEARKAA
jgi:hypothetical protein